MSVRGKDIFGLTTNEKSEGRGAREADMVEENKCLVVNVLI